MLMTMMRMRPSLLLLLACVVVSLDAFQISPGLAVQRNAPNSSSSFLQQSHDSSSSFSMEALLARQREIESQQSMLVDKWKNADCVSRLSVALPDWVRRIDVDYPLVACGSASSTVFVAHLETGKVLAHSGSSETMEHSLQGGDAEENELDGLQETLRMLYGSFDGGGTLAIAVRRNLICSAARTGSVQVHRFDKDTNELIFQGTMAALENSLVTTLHLDDEYLWVGTADGRLLCYSHGIDSGKDELPLVLQTEPALQWNFGSCVLAVSIHPEVGYAVVATAKGSIELLAMVEDDNDDDKVQSSVVAWYPPFDSGSIRRSRHTVPLSVTLVAHSDGQYSMACGASDGSLFVHPLQWNVEEHCLDDKRPLKNGMLEGRPRHSGPVKCLTSPGEDLLVSGGQDGTVRLWNVEPKEATSLYQWIGFKVWLGSMWTDGARLVTDGADNTIVMHDFEAEEGDDVSDETR